jgi:hypothetical protein
VPAVGFMDSVKKVGLAVVTGGASTLVEHRHQQKLLETGKPGRAVVKEFRRQWDMDDDALVSRQSVRWGASQMTLEVRPNGGAPYVWSGEMWVRVKHYDALPGTTIVGTELPVKVDRADPQKVAVDWDAAAAEAGVQ